MARNTCVLASQENLPYFLLPLTSQGPQGAALQAATHSSINLAIATTSRQQQQRRVSAMASSPATAPAAPPAAAAAPDARLAAFRQALAQADGGKGVQAFIVPSEDPHMVGAALCCRSKRGQGETCRLCASIFSCI